MHQKSRLESPRQMTRAHPRHETQSPKLSVRAQQALPLHPDGPRLAKHKVNHSRNLWSRLGQQTRL
jgi:hypothetical protein